MANEKSIRSIKQGAKCICGKRKFKGAPFCTACWSVLDEETRTNLRLTSDFDNVFLATCRMMKEKGALSEALELPETAVEPVQVLAESPAQALAMVGLCEAQLDRVYFSASLEQKAAAVRALLKWDRNSNPA